MESMALKCIANLQLKQNFFSKVFSDLRKQTQIYLSAISKVCVVNFVSKGKTFSIIFQKFTVEKQCKSFLKAIL